VVNTRVNGYEKNVRRFLIIVALAPIVGLGVFLTWPYFSQETDRRPAVEVIVAAHDLSVGTVLDDHDIRIIRIPAADLPPGAPRRRSEVLGHRLTVPIAKGEFIFPSRLQH
jgi:Flp pilus assembly protein CpaB